MNVKDVLLYGEQFYKPKYPRAKEGIGHENEHIKGVLKRGQRIVETMKENPVIFKDFTYDADVLAAALALHDIGNTIDRENHNIFGRGIVQGYLSLEDILSAPSDCITNPGSNKGIYALDENEWEELRDYVEAHHINNIYNFEDVDETLSDKQYFALYDAIDIKTQFDKFFFDYDFSSKEMYKNYISSIYKTSYFMKDDLTAAYNMMPEEDTNSFDIEKEIERAREQTEVSKKLRKYSALINDVFDKSQIKVIAEAVQDHNIDRNIDSSRYESRSIIGMIVADADKDNCINTFICRSYAFAKNKLFKNPRLKLVLSEETSHNMIIETNGEGLAPSSKYCADNIIGQIHQRFKPNHKPGDVFDTEFLETMLVLVKSVNGIKSITRVAEDTQTEQTVHTVPNVDRYNRTIAAAGEHFCVNLEQGVDIYSQIDAHFNTTVIKDLSKDFYEQCSKFSNPDNYQESMKYIMDIEDQFDDAPSIEFIIDAYEKDMYAKIYDEDYRYYFYTATEYKDIVAGIVDANKERIELNELSSLAKETGLPTECLVRKGSSIYYFDANEPDKTNFENGIIIATKEDDKIVQIPKSISAIKDFLKAYEIKEAKTKDYKGRDDDIVR